MKYWSRIQRIHSTTEWSGTLQLPWERQRPNWSTRATTFLVHVHGKRSDRIFFWYFLFQLPLQVYDRKVKREKDFFGDPFQAQFFTVTLLASVYIGALYLTDMSYYIYNWNNLNVFIVLKMVFITMPFMGWVLLVAVYYYKPDTLRSNIKPDTLRSNIKPDTLSSNIIRIVLVGILTHEIVLILLSIFPTLLLLFA